MEFYKYKNLFKRKSNKIAAFIINYNMPENSDKLYEYLLSNVKYPLDIFLVDNGSDLIAPSRYTNVFIKKNIQTTGGWLRAFEEADKKPYKYFAYMFLFTSFQFTPQSKDPVSSMIEIFEREKDAVGVIPSISEDSEIYWDHLKNRGTNDFRRTWLIDNIASIWKADWLDSIGRVNKDLIYAYGIDVEMCYWARKQNKSVWIDEKIEVKKITDIGYKMNRMNMSASDRGQLGWANTVEVLSHKYGPNWYDELYNKYIDDSWR